MTGSDEIEQLDSEYEALEDKLTALRQEGERWSPEYRSILAERDKAWKELQQAEKQLKAEESKE